MEKLAKGLYLLPVLLLAFLFNSSTVNALSVETVGNQWRGYSKVLSEDDDKRIERERNEKKLEIQEKLREKERLRIEAQEHRLLLKTHKRNQKEGAEDSAELELDEGEELEVQEGTTSGKIKIKAGNGDVVIIRNRIAARTNFPLSIDTETNELIVTTPAGTKRVAVLPDVAIRNMLASGFIDEALKEASGDDVEEVATESAGIDKDQATKSAETQEIEEEVELTTTEEGLLAYEIEGYKTQSFLGVLNVKVKRTVYASADTGEFLEIKQNLFNRIIDAFSV